MDRRNEMQAGLGACVTLFVVTDGDPDPRFSLANERTFLAWIRTALGLLACAAALVAIDLPWPAPAVRTLAIVLAAAAGLSSLLAWRRWLSVEQAIAAGRAAPTPRAHVVLSGTVVAVSLVVVMLILVA